MQIPRAIVSIALCACTSAIVACASRSGGSEAPLGAAQAVPAPGPQNAGRNRALERRIRANQACTGTGSGSFVGGSDANAAAATDSGVLAGTNNGACDNESGIGTGGFNTIASGGGQSFIAAGSTNTISGADAFIGAGYQNSVSGGNGAIATGATNTVSGDSSFIGGGSGNSAAGNFNFIGSGVGNTNSSFDGVLGGGTTNVITAINYAFIGGGANNKVSGQYGVIGGGSQNTASGTESTVAGGGNNIASGYASFAAGSHADAVQGGSFVWSDTSTSVATKATLANQFVARASGGVEFFSNKTMTTGVKLAAGGGSWASLSDRSVKTNVVPIDDANILDKVAAMPITQWSYISERGVRHVGPMAQDFYAAFGIGEDNKHITSVDEDGVALAAIKALNAQLMHTNARLEQKDAALQRQMQAMKVQMAQLVARVVALR